MTEKTFADFGIELRTNSGEEDTTCPECSESRKNKRARCLSVNIDKGVWTCHHCGWSGGLGTGEQHRPVIAKTWRRPQYEPARISLSEELSRWLFVWMTFLGAVVALGDRAHLGTDMLVGRLGRRGKQFCLALAYLAIAQR